LWAEQQFPSGISDLSDRHVPDLSQNFRVSKFGGRRSRLGSLLLDKRQRFSSFAACRSRGRYARVLAFNPLLILVRGYRAIFLEGRPPQMGALIVLWLGSAALAVLGHAWFHRLRRSFADVI
jgi:hypothetical protein